MTLIGTTDLHSMVQYTLGGPRNAFTTFVSVAEALSEKQVPACVQISAQEPVPVCPEIPTLMGVQGKSVNTIKHAVLEGVKKAYAGADRPYMSLELKSISPQAIGAFLYFKMIEIVCLGHLLTINPFDQPEVELYKREARKILEQ